MSHKNNIIMAILFIMIIFNFMKVNCQEQQQYKIKFGKDIYSVLPEIPSEYNIVKQNNLGTSKDNKPEGNILSLQKNTKFAQKQAPDFYALKSSDAEHQSNRYKYIKGKNIFTPEYLQNQYKKSQNQQYQKPTITPHGQKTKESTLEAQKKPQMMQNPPVPNYITQKKKNQQIINQKSAQLYNEFKNIEILKEKNLRDTIKSTFETEILTQNFMKIIGYVVVGLIFAFAIIKKATKSQPSVPRRNQERSELRLRDTVEDDQSESSSDSDEQM